MKRSPLKRKTPLKPKLDQLIGSGLVQRASSFKPKQKPMRKRAVNNKGWWDVAKEIWAERTHICCVCGRSLGDEPRPIFFSHLLPRGLYRNYKRDKRNIVLKCGPCHTVWTEKLPFAWEHMKTDSHGKLHAGWMRVLEQYRSLKAEANGLAD